MAGYLSPKARRARRVGAAVAVLLLVGSALAAAESSWTDVHRLQDRLASGWRYVALGWWREAAAQFLQAAATRPEDAEAHLLLALALQASGSPERALDHLELAARAPAAPPGLAALAGDVLLAEGRLAEAEAAYRGALDQDPALVRPLHGLAVILQAQGRHAEARPLLERVVEAAPDLADARLRLGRLLREAGELEAARSHLETASRLEPRHAGIQLELGRVYEGLGQRGRALHAYELALEHQPGLVEARRRIAALSGGS